MFLELLLMSQVASTGLPIESTTCDISHVNLSTLENVAVMDLAPKPLEQTFVAAQDAVQKNDLGRFKSTLEVAAASVPSGGEVLGYTRLRIDYEPCVTQPSGRYAKESRSGVERFLFGGQVDNHVLKFDASIDPIGVKTSSQLYSMLRDSGRDGQNWTTEVRNDDYLLPYFRVDRSSVLNFKANFQAEGSSKLEIGGTLLDIVQRGAKLITPQAALITDENLPMFNDAANFVDESLSKLFYKKVTETARQGIRIEPGPNLDQPLVRILLIAPNPTKTYITTEKYGRVVGQWTVFAEKLRKSLFVENAGDLADVAKLDAATVLNLKIGDKEILRDRLSGSEAITKAAQGLAKAEGNAVGPAAIGLCRLVAAEATKVGLAPYDVAVATWAYLADQGMAQTKHGLASTACRPVRHFPHES